MHALIFSNHIDPPSQDYITIFRSKINQNRNNLITKLTIHLNDRCLMVRLPIVHNCVDPRNVMTNIPNYIFLLRTIDMGSTTLILWKIPLIMILATYPTLQWCSTIASGMLLSMSLLNYIELLVRECILFSLSS